MINEIILYVIAIFPSLSAILGTISAVIAIKNKFNGLVKKVEETTDVKDLKKLLHKVVKENIELKRLIKKDIEAKTHVEVKVSEDDNEV